MQHAFTYDKKKVIQGLRYHFVQRPEVKVLVVLVNVFAIVAAILFYSKKIRPEPFLLGSFIWIMMMASFWYIMPNSIYKKALDTFTDQFTIAFKENGITLENERGFIHWNWKEFSHYFESPHFFHLYFSSRSFFMIPKDAMVDSFRHELRAALKNGIKK